VGVILLGKLAEVNALAMLLVHMNSLQTRFLFEVLPAGVTPVGGGELRLFELCQNRAATTDDVDTALKTFALDYESRLADIEIENRCVSQSRFAYVVVSQLRIENDYFILFGDRVACVALGNWKKRMAPPSIVEFVLTLVVGAVGQLMQSDPDRSNHYGTRGCIFDYADDVGVARYQVLEGHVCADCERLLALDDVDAADLRALKILASRQWLTKPKGPLSPASMAAALEYNLFMTKGLSPSLAERARALLTEDAPKEVIKLLFALLLAYLLLRFSLKAGAGD
jgi:hypothetical protein